MDLIPILIELSAVLALFAVLNFTISIVIKRNDLADVAWGIGYILVCVYLWSQYPLTATSQTAYLMVILWGLRLSLHIGIRNSKKGEDFRYKKWRQEWGSTFYVRSFFQVYLLQMSILLIVSFSVIFAAIESPNSPLSPFQWAMVMLWSVGFIWEVVADYQLSQFKKKKSGTVLMTGLWKFSRHPNYFGEIVMWWSLCLFVLPSIEGYALLVSPVLITYLLMKVSGVPMLEEKYRENEAYQSYRKRTPAIFPFTKWRFERLSN